MSHDQEEFPHWLLASLHAAASKAGLAGWFPLVEISTAVAVYLYPQGEVSTLDMESVNTLVRRALQQVGLREVAENFQAVNPQHQLSLLDCATNPPTLSAEVFFQCLRASIVRMHSQGAQHIHFKDLTACEAALQAAHGCFPSSQPTVNRNRIVAEVRRHLRRLDWPHKVRCLIE